MNTATEAKSGLQKALDELGVEMVAEFVPFSKRPRRDESAADMKKLADWFADKPAKLTQGDLSRLLCINWRCRFTLKGRELIETPYFQGIGHLPKDFEKQFVTRWSIDGAKATKKMIEAGAAIVYGRPFRVTPPNCADVFWSLLMDSDALDYSTFEEWADSVGYDQDSRKAEKIYRACLGIALKLRAALGDETLGKLREISAEM